MANKSVRSLVSAVIAAAYGLNAGVPTAAIAATEPVDPTPDVWSTIERINANNPNSFLKVSVAREAGRSELVSAIVQAAKTAASADELNAAIEAAILRVGGLSSKNVIPLAELLAALRAMGISEDFITSTLNTYSVHVADAVATGTLTASVAAAILVEGASQNLYS
ncbi:hypothetical protein [Devosia sp. CN2-171]|uniref:hypothetical protein n=1 Tax=Devosia sp. CN2-171 TaxID=3400909 RepID=UPI003BF783DE